MNKISFFLSFVVRTTQIMKSLAWAVLGHFNTAGQWTTLRWGLYLLQKQETVSTLHAVASNIILYNTRKHTFYIIMGRDIVWQDQIILPVDSEYFGCKHVDISFLPKFIFFKVPSIVSVAIAQLGERKTEDNQWSWGPVFDSPLWHHYFCRFLLHLLPCHLCYLHPSMNNQPINFVHFVELH